MKHFAPIVAASEALPSEVIGMASELANHANRLALDAIVIEGRLHRPALPGEAIGKALTLLAQEAAAFTDLTIRLAERIRALEARAAA